MKKMIENEKVLDLVEIEHQIKVLKNQLKVLEKQESELKDSIVGQMEYEQLKLFENDEIKITRVAGRQMVSIDIEALKNEMPEVFEKYKKVTTTKESTRITLKGGF